MWKQARVVHVEAEDGRVDVMDDVGPCYTLPFFMYYVIGTF
jgi:hypothetical protein